MSSVTECHQNNNASSTFFPLKKYNIFLGFCTLSYGLLALILQDFTIFFIRHLQFFNNLGLVLSHCRNIEILNITLLTSKVSHNWTYKIFKGMDYRFTGFDTLSRRKQLNFTFNFNCRFYFFSRMKIPGEQQLSLVFHRGVTQLIFWFENITDSFLAFENNSLKNHFLTSLLCSFLSFC